jgi:hypothetical protein
VSLPSLSFIALILAFIPLLLARGDFGTATLWRLSSRTMILFSLLGFAAAPSVNRRLLAEVELDTRLPILFMLLPATLNLGAQLANSIPLFWEPNSVPYVVGMLFWLYSAGMQFVLIVLYRPQAE